MKKVKVLGIIPARGGSTSIKLKNIANVGGKPLIYYTIREAKKSKLLDAFIVATDSELIADVARKYGVDVPFIRPKHTAKKYSVEIEYQQHALQWLEKHRGWKPETVVILKPTAPLRPASLIDEVISVAQKGNYSAVRTFSSPANHPYRMWTMEGTTMKPILPEFVVPAHFKKWGYEVPRQRLPKVHWCNYAVEAINADAIRKGIHAVSAGPIGGVITDPEISVDIDEPRDLEIVAELLKKRK